MNLERLRFWHTLRDIFKTVAFVLTVLVLILSCFIGAIHGQFATNWTDQMKHECFGTMPHYLIGERYEKNGVTYECIPIPEHMEKAVVGETVDLRKPDDIIRGEIIYLMYKDPFETGENVVFFYPFYSAGASKDPLSFYVKVVNEG